MEAFTTKGHWWLPSNPDHKVEGVLTFDPGGGSILELSDVLKFEKVIFLGTFTGSETIILGEDDEGQSITLVNCSEEPPHIDFSDSSLPVGVLVYRPRYIVQGCHLEQEERVVFRQLTVDYYGLQVWADPRRRAGFSKPAFTTSDEIPIDDILVSAGSFNVRIRRNFSHDSHSEKDSDKRYALIDFLTPEPWKLEEFLPVLFNFQVFLSLAMHTATWPTMLQAPHPNKENHVVSIHYAPATGNREANDLASTFMYFTLEDALPYLEQGLSRWFEKFEKLYRVFQMFNWAISRKLFLDEQFMIYARAVEVYHRQRHGGTYVDKAIYSEIREQLEASIPEGTDERLKQGIVSSLEYANSLSLRGRLKDIRNRHQECSDRLFENYSPFVNDVVNTRNYLTHFDEKNKESAKLGFRDLYHMRERLRIILEICLLFELGLGNLEIQRIVRGSAVSLPM